MAGQAPQRHRRRGRPIGGFPRTTDPPRYRHKLDKTVCFEPLTYVKAPRGPWSSCGWGEQMANLGKKTRESLALAVVLGMVAGGAMAQALTEEDVIAELQSEGFQVVDTGTTLLGRLRITATGPEGTREVILNLRNGKVLRDVIIQEAPEKPMDIPKTEIEAEPVAPAATPPGGGGAAAHGAEGEPTTPNAVPSDDEADGNQP